MSVPASILVADGSRDCADAVAMMLASNGMRASVAYDAPAALSLLAHEPFDGAVMDITIPGGSALEVAEECRRLRGGSIRLVAYTAWPASAARAPAPFDQVVSKASDPLDLLRAISAETYGALLRSMQASANHLRIELQFADSLLDRAWLLQSAAQRQDLHAFVEKRMRFVESASRRLLMSEAREAIEADLGVLRARIAKSY